MIAPLRKRHFIMVILMAVIAIPLFVLALLNREPVAPQTLSGALASESSLDAYPTMIAEVTFAGKADQLTARIIGDNASPVRMALDVMIHEPIKAPNLLLYWMPGEDFQEAVLIGSFPTISGGLIELTPKMKKPNGNLVLYSLGHQEEFARAAVNVGEVTP